MQQRKRNQNEHIISTIYQQIEHMWNCQIKPAQLVNSIAQFFDSILIQAERRNPQACFVLGLCYQSGYVVSINLVQAKNWYKRALKRGQIHCIFNLYLIQTDYVKSNKLIRKGVINLQHRCIAYALEHQLTNNIPLNPQRLRQIKTMIQTLLGRNYLPAYRLAWCVYNKKGSNFYSKQAAESYLKLWHKKSNPQMDWQLFYGSQLYQFNFADEALPVLHEFFHSQRERAQKYRGQLESLIANCNMKIGNKVSAIDWLERAAETGYVPAYYSLLQIYKKQGQRQMQEEMLQTIEMYNHRMRNELNGQEYDQMYECNNSYDWNGMKDVKQTRSWRL